MKKHILAKGLLSLGVMLMVLSGLSPFGHDAQQTAFAQACTIERLSGPAPTQGGVSGFDISPNGNTVAYRSDASTTGRFELFSVPTVGGSSANLSTGMPTEGSIENFRFSPDSNRVVYIRDDNRNQDGQAELYSVPAGGGTPIKLSGNQVAFGNVLDFAISANSGTVIFWGDQQTNGVNELYSVPINGSSAAIKLNPSLPNGGDISSFAISPNSQRVVYIADQNSDGIDELFSAPIGGGGVIRLSLTPQPTSDVRNFQISPDSQRVVFIADQDTDNSFEIYSVPINGGQVTKLNTPTGTSTRDVDFNFQISPDSQRVVFTGDLNTEGTTDLYSNAIFGPTVSMVKLNSGLSSANISGVGDEPSFRISANSSWVVFTGDQTTPNVIEVFSVPIAGGAQTRLNAPLNNGNITGYIIAPNSGSVVYRSSENGNTVHRLQSIAITGGSPQVWKTTNTSVIPTSKITFNSSGSRVLFFDALDGQTLFELYSVSLTGTDLQRVNQAITSATSIGTFLISPTSNRVLYSTSTNNGGNFVFELFSSCDGGAEGSVVKAGHTLAMHNPNNNSISLIDTLNNPPGPSNYNTYTLNAPVDGRFVLGDWDGNGTETPGIYGTGAATGAFYFTNEVSPSANWSAIWIGVNSYQVLAGRMNAAVQNDCVGAVERADVDFGGVNYTVFVLYYTCDLSGNTQTPTITWHWVSAPLPDVDSFTGTHQLALGDWNNDGLDTIGARRNDFISYSNVPIVNPSAVAPQTPNNTYAEFAFAQYWGFGPSAEGISNPGQFVAGDWNNDGSDTFGVIYDNNFFYYRDDLEWNTGIYLPQQLSNPVGAGRVVTTWQRVLSGATFTQATPAPLSPIEDDLGSLAEPIAPADAPPSGLGELESLEPSEAEPLQPLNPEVDEQAPLSPFEPGQPSRQGLPQSDARLSTELLLALETSRTAPNALNSFGAQRGLEFDGDKVLVNILATDTAAAEGIAASLPNVGGELLAIYETSIDAKVPMANLERLSRLSGVVIVQDVIPVNFDVTTMPTPADLSLQTGSSVTQGVALSNINTWHAAGFGGQGVRVGVIDAFQDYTTAQAQGELPSDIQTLGSLNLGSRHGTAVAEIIYDMAPNVTFTFASPFSPASMASTILDLAQSGHKVISSSISFDNAEPGDGTGLISDAITQAYNQYGTLYVQSAGNRALSHWYGPFVGYQGGITQQFESGSGPTNVNQIGFIPSNAPIRLAMRWNGWPTTNQDYDLSLVYFNQAENAWQNVRDSQGNVVGSYRDQTGQNLDPTETLSFFTLTSQYYGFVIERFSADGTQVLNIVSRSHNFITEAKADYSLSDPAHGQRTFSVAAVDASTPYTLEPYSSRGPTFSPGGTLGGSFLQRPRIAGFANVDTYSYGPGVFNGTSSATPHVAGAAAVVLSANPDFSPGQIQTFLEGRAIDMGPSGYDSGYGVGRLHLGDPPTQQDVDSLALFNPATGQARLIDALPTGSGLSYAYNPPIPNAAANKWVMGDWNGDGTQTPGVFNGGAFHYTNTSNGTAWSDMWLGANGPAVLVGRFDASLNNDCVGVLESADLSGYLVFALYYACDFSTVTPTINWHWVSAPLPSQDNFTGTHQFTVGDWNGDGADTIAARRGEFIAYSDVPIVNPSAQSPQTPNNTYAEFSGGQFWGAPNANTGYFVGGNWDGLGGDSFGVLYEGGTEYSFIYKNNVAWNEGTALTISIFNSLGSGLNVAAWTPNTSTALTAAPGASLELAPLAADEVPLGETTTLDEAATLDDGNLGELAPLVPSGELETLDEAPVDELAPLSP